MMRDLLNPHGFLYEQLDVLSRFGALNEEIPDSITRNLNPAFEIREYQEEAFARFIYCLREDFDGKSEPLHLLFNMATGSGKTLIMAGLILYLYEKGYRNFLFFVNSTNIIRKTQNNFLNLDTSKYLFNKEIYIGGKRVALTEVENFEDINENDINICFTTIQQLHTDMTTERENALTYESFADKKIVLLADEAHHMNVSTRSQSRSQLEMFESWENTMERIFQSNENNLLLEFTATHDYESSDMSEKYRDKVIYRYDFKNYRDDRYSKDITLVHSDLDLQDRVLQALILNQYKQQIAAKHRIQLKPVILFKAQKTIAQSQENKANFRRLIDELTGNQIDRIRASEVEVVQSAFRFFDERNISSEQLAQYLKSDFQERYCLSVNDETEKETNQILVNTLEDKENPIRAIFAVQKLNEGWDVLNLFDIVRCYETRDTRYSKPGRTTISEAQLIGRGARYFPFTLSDNDAESNHSVSDEKFRRKFDRDLDHELRVLEELHYHSVNNSRYISEIQTALRDEGIIDETVVTRELKLRASFKETDLYKYGVLWVNKRAERDYQNVTSFADLADLSVRRKNHEHTVHAGSGGAMAVMENEATGGTRNTDIREVRLVDIEQNIVQSAIARNPFFKFASLKRYFPQLTSMHEFRTSRNYLGGLAITFKGDFSYLEENPSEKLTACCDLLDKIEIELRKQITDYEGTTKFHEERINAIFTGKKLKFSADNPRINPESQMFDEQFVSVRDWYAFNGLYGTSEERGLVRFLSRWISQLEETYEDIYLLRNERHFSLYNFSDGRGFEPDFVLFLREKNGELLTYQLFIEPKGQHLMEQDRWKEDFLKEIRAKCDSQLLIENTKYSVVGVGAFYNEDHQDKFRTKFNKALEDAHQMQKQDN